MDALVIFGLLGFIVVVLLASIFFLAILRQAKEIQCEAARQKAIDAQTIAFAVSKLGAQVETAGKREELLALEIRQAASHFAPVKNIPCPRCAGAGQIEKENPLFIALADALSAGAEKIRKNKK